MSGVQHRDILAKKEVLFHFARNSKSTKLRIGRNEMYNYVVNLRDTDVQKTRSLITTTS